MDDIGESLSMSSDEEYEELKAAIEKLKLNTRKESIDEFLIEKSPPKSDPIAMGDILSYISKESTANSIPVKSIYDHLDSHRLCEVLIHDLEVSDTLFLSSDDSDFGEPSWHAEEIGLISELSALNLEAYLEAHRRPL